MEQPDDYASTAGSRSYDEDEDSHDAFEEYDTAAPRVVTAATELDTLCRTELAHISGMGPAATCNGFPSKLLPIVLLFPGNHCCVDCGNEEIEGLQYGSVGYGTILCEVCANRHIMYTGEESIIRPLTTATWPLRSILAILAGSNSQMLEYVRSKPRWRPSKSDSADDPEVLAFKQIYLSKAAAAYRDTISEWVDKTYKEKLTQVQMEIVAQEQLFKMQNAQPVDPFDAIFARNNVSREDIPGFATGNKANRNSGLGDSFTTVKGANTANTRHMITASSMAPEDVRAKIRARRNRNPSIRAQAQMASDMAQDMMRGMNLGEDGTEYHQQSQSVYDHRYFRRRSIDMVGEVEHTEFDMHDQEYDDVDQYQWGSGYSDDMASVQMSMYGTNNLPRYKNADAKSVGLSVASIRGRGYDDQTLGSMPLDSAGVRLGTYRRTSMDGA